MKTSLWRAISIGATLLAAPAVIASGAAAKGPEQAYRVPLPASSETSSPPLAGACPCVIDIGRDPSRILVKMRFVRDGKALAAIATSTGRTANGTPHSTATGPGGGYDWEAASAGAAVTTGIAVIFAGAALTFRRRRLDGALSRP